MITLFPVECKIEEKHQFSFVSFQLDRIELVHLPKDDRYVQATNNRFAKPIDVPLETERMGRKNDLNKLVLSR